MTYAYYFDEKNLLQKELLFTNTVAIYTKGTFTFFSIGKLCFEMNDITLTNIYACATDEVLAMFGTTNIVINSK